MPRALLGFGYITAVFREARAEERARAKHAEDRRAALRQREVEALETIAQELKDKSA
jgi:hypothetical protein